MEYNMDDFHNDECELIYSSCLTVVKIFTNNNREYFKLDPEILKNKQKISEKEKDILDIIENIKEKYYYLAKIKSCKNPSHLKLAFDLDHLFEDNKRMIIHFNKEKSAKNEILKKYKNIEYENSSEEEDIEYNNDESVLKEKKKEMEIIINKFKESIDLKNKEDKNNSDLNNNFNDNKNYYFNNDGEKQQQMCEMEKDSSPNILGEIDIFTLEEIIENSKEYKGDEQFRNNLKHLKNQIQELTLGLESGIIQSKEKLDLIADNTNIIDENVEDVNKHLREAALEKNKFNKVKYPILLGGLGSGLGLIVPGFGTIIGGSIGSLLGVLLAKLERKQINKIEPNKNEK